MANPAARRLLGVTPRKEGDIVLGLGAAGAAARAAGEGPAAAAAVPARRVRAGRSFWPWAARSTPFCRASCRSAIPTATRWAPPCVLQDVTRFRLLDQVKSDLVATVSHELKTPLTSIRLAVHLLLEEAVGPLTPKQTELLLDARDNTERLLAMINNLLDLARLEEGRGSWSVCRESPASLLHAAAEAIRPRADDKGVDVAVEAAGRSAAGRGRCRATGPRPAQPARQRPDLHRPRRPDHAGGGTCRRRRGPVGGRHRHRHPAGAPAARLREILPRAGPDAGARHRTGAGHRPRDRRGPRRQDHLREPARRGHDVPPHAAGGAWHRQGRGRGPHAIGDSDAHRRRPPGARALPDADPPAAARPAQGLPRLRRRRRQDLRDAPGGHTASSGRAWTSSSASSKRTAGPRPPPRSATSNRCRAAASSTTASSWRRWTSTPSSPAGRPSCLVDELAHTNAPGSRNAKRYQDVEELLRAGINVIRTLNIQHLESLYDMVERATGVKVKERVPDYVLGMADQLVNVDVSAEDLRERLKPGKVYPQERIERRWRISSPQENLTRLREMALGEIAHLLDRRRREQNDGEEAGGTPSGSWSASARAAPVRSSCCARRRAWPTASGAPGTPSTSRRPGEEMDRVDAATQRQVHQYPDPGAAAGRHADDVQGGRRGQHHRRLRQRIRHHAHRPGPHAAALVSALVRPVVPRPAGAGRGSADVVVAGHF